MICKRIDLFLDQQKNTTFFFLDQSKTKLRYRCGSTMGIHVCMCVYIYIYMDVCVFILARKSHKQLCPRELARLEIRTKDVGQVKSGTSAVRESHI